MRGAQPCFVFVGEQFDNVPEFRLAKSLLLDVFRGRVVDGINLKVRKFVPTERWFCHPYISIIQVHMLCSQLCVRVAA